MAVKVDHKQLAAEYFNLTWDLLEKTDRAQEDNDEMIHAAHASRFHWGKVGNAVTFYAVNGKLRGFIRCWNAGKQPCIIRKKEDQELFLKDLATIKG